MAGLGAQAEAGRLSLRRYQQTTALTCTKNGQSRSPCRCCTVQSARRLTILYPSSGSISPLRLAVRQAGSMPVPCAAMCMYIHTDHRPRQDFGSRPGSRMQSQIGETWSWPWPLAVVPVHAALARVTGWLQMLVPPVSADTCNLAIQQQGFDGRQDARGLHVVFLSRIAGALASVQRLNPGNPRLMTIGSPSWRLPDLSSTTSPRTWAGGEQVCLGRRQSRLSTPDSKPTKDARVSVAGLSN